MPKGKWIISFFVADKWLYDTIEIRPGQIPAEVLREWWSRVHSQSTWMFETDGGKSRMIIPKGSIVAAEIYR